MAHRVGAEAMVAFRQEGGIVPTCEMRQGEQGDDDARRVSRHLAAIPGHAAFDLEAAAGRGRQEQRLVVMLEEVALSISGNTQSLK